jgi:hypothetical protein
VGYSTSIFTGWNDSFPHSVDKALPGRISQVILKETVVIIKEKEHAEYKEQGAGRLFCMDGGYEWLYML